MKLIKRLFDQDITAAMPICLDKILKQKKHSLEIASIKITETGETKRCRMIKLWMITDSSLQPLDASDLSPAFHYKINKKLYILKIFKRVGKSMKTE